MKYILWVFIRNILSLFKMVENGSEKISFIYKVCHL